MVAVNFLSISRASSHGFGTTLRSQGQLDCRWRTFGGGPDGGFTWLWQVQDLESVGRFDVWLIRMKLLQTDCIWHALSCETCLIMFVGYLFGILVDAFKFPRLKLTRCASNRVFQFSSKCDFATMCSIFPSIVISILWTAGSLGGKVGVPMMVVYSPFNRCETLMRLTLDMVDVGLLCWVCRHM